MASPSIVIGTPESQVLNFKQRGEKIKKMLGIEFAMLRIYLLVSNPLRYFFEILCGYYYLV